MQILTLTPTLPANTDPIFAETKLQQHSSQMTWILREDK